MVKKTLSFSERLIEMVDEIQEIKGYPSFSALVHQAVVELHAKFFPAYARMPREVKTPVEKAQAKHALKQAEEQIVTEEQIKICTKLGGKVVKGVNPEDSLCEYYTYNFKNRYLQEVLLGELSLDLIKNQYHPSKQRVEDLRSKKKK